MVQETDFPRDVVPRGKRPLNLAGGGKKKRPLAKKPLKKPGGAPREKKPKLTAKFPGLWTSGLTRATIAVDQLLLGVVRRVDDTSATLEVAGATRVRLDASNMGAQFIAAAKKGEIAMRDALEPGQALALRVLEKAQDKEVGVRRTKIMQPPKVTCDPAKVNRHLTLTAVPAGTALTASVLGLEEKGATLALGGLDGQTARGFLPFENVPSTLKLVVGRPILVRVVSSTARVIQCSAAVEQDTLAEATVEKLNASNLLPGTTLMAEPLEHVRGGVVAVLGNDLKCYIRADALPPRLRAQPQLFVRPLRVVVTAVQSNTPLLVVSAHPDLVAVSRAERRASFAEEKKGDDIEGALIKGKVVRIVSQEPPKIEFQPVLEEQQEDSGDEDEKENGSGKNRQSSVKVSNLVTAVAAGAHVQLPKHGKTLFETYPIDSVHTLRVVHTRWFERELGVSTRVIDVKTETGLVTIGDAQPGAKISVQVRDVTDARLMCSTLGTGTKHINVLVPATLATDKKLAPLTKLFKAGDKLHVRVLYVNTDPTRRTIVAVARKSVLQSKLEPLTEYSESAVGKTAQGFVMTKQWNGTARLVVHFYNHVVGSLHHEAAKLLPSTKEGTPLDLKVLAVDAERRLMKLGLPTDEIIAKKNAEAPPDNHAVKVCSLAKATVQGLWTLENTAKKEEEKKKTTTGVQAPTAIRLALPGKNIGRLHVCELPDEVIDAATENHTKTAAEIFLARNQNKTVNVRICELTKVKRKGQDPLRIFECSLRPAKLKITKKKQRLLNYTRSFNYGQEVVAVLACVNEPNGRVEVELSPAVKGLVRLTSFERSAMWKKTCPAGVPMADALPQPGTLLRARIIGDVHKKSASKSSARICVPLSVADDIHADTAAEIASLREARKRKHSVASSGDGEEALVDAADDDEAQEQKEEEEEAEAPMDVGFELDADEGYTKEELAELARMTAELDAQVGGTATQSKEGGAAKKKKRRR